VTGQQAAAANGAQAVLVAYITAWQWAALLDTGAHAAIRTFQKQSAVGKAALFPINDHVCIKCELQSNNVAAAWHNPVNCRRCCDMLHL
jgi:hypothetical protein